MNKTTTVSASAAGLLNDEEAFSVYRAIPTEQDEGKRGALVGLLGKYTEAKRAQGLEPFQPSPEVLRAQTERFERLYTSLDAVESNLAPEQVEQMKGMLDTSPDPAAVKARMVNMAYLQQQHGKQLPPGWDGENWPAMRSAYAKQVLGLDMADVSDVELFQAIGGRIEQQKAERVMLMDVVAKVQMAAFEGAGSWLEAYEGAAGGMDASEGYDPKARDRYRAVAKRAFEQVKEQADRLRPVAKTIVGSLAAEMEVTAGAENHRGFSMDELVQMVDAVPDKDRHLLYAIVAQMAEISPDTAEAKDKSLGKQTGEAVGRGLVDVLRANKRALNDNPKLIHARTMAGAVDRLTVQGKRKQGETVLDWANRSLSGNYGIVDFVVDVAKQEGQPFLRDRRKLTDDEQAALKDEVTAMERDRSIRTELRQIAEGVIDPIKGSNFFTEKVYYPALQNAAYTGQAFVPFAGLPLLISSTVGMRSEEMMARGASIEDAQGMGLVSAVIEAPVEMMQAKMVAGAFPIFKGLLSAPVAGLKQMAGRAAGVLGVQILEQNVQEAVQDAMPLLVQHVASSLKESVPGLDWNKELEAYGKGRVDTFWALMPMVLIGTGSATFSDAAYGRQYLNDMTTLKAAGFTEEAAAKIIEAPTMEEKQAIVRASWNDERLRVMNGEAQLAALADMDETMREAYVEATGDGARIARLEDGSFEVTTPDGELVDIAVDADAALDLARDWNRADNLNMETAIQDMVAYVESFQEAGQSIEVVQGSRSLQDRVDAGDYTAEEAEAIVDTYVALGRLERGSTAADALITGENEVTRYDGRRRIVADVSRIYEGANPLTVVEEHVEGYLKRRLADGAVTLEDVARWRESVDGAGNADTSERGLMEWFSEQAQAYLVGKSDAEAVPASFRSFLMKLKQYFTRVMDLAVRLMEKERAGELPDGFKTHLARAVGLDDAFIDSQRRADEESQLGGRGEELMSWLKGRLPHPETARANGEQLAGELQAVWEGFKSPQAARAFFAPKGQYTPLDQLAGMAKDDGFAFETADDLLQGIDSSLRGVELFAEAGTGETTFSLGDYAIPHRPNNEGPRAFDLAEDNMMPGDVYDHPEWYSAYSGKELRETLAQLKKVKGKPDGLLTIYRAGPRAEMNKGDWVTLSRTYAKNHAKLDESPENDMKVWQATVSAKEVRWSMDDLAEFGYFGELVEGKPVGADRTFSLAPMFSEDNRLSNIARGGTMWTRIVKENPVLRSDPTEVTAYRAAIGSKLRPNDFVALNRQVAVDHLENLKDRGESGTVTAHKVKVADLLMANDATEFVWFPAGADRTFSVTDSKAFKAWFGKSKVVDADGNPLVVYHGTNEDFGKFSVVDGLVGWFTSSPDFAANFGATEGQSLYPVFLKMERPLDLAGATERYDVPTWRAILSEAGLDDADAVNFGEEVNVEDAREFSFWELVSPKFEDFSTKGSDLLGRIKAQGYDGIFVPSERLYKDDKNFVVFSPEQVKSAIGNRGTFDAANPNITMAMESRRRVDEIHDEMKMRRVAARVVAGEHAGESFAPAVRKAMEGLMYQVVPNKVTVEEALKIVDTHGVTEALNIVMSNTADHPANVQVALGLALMEHFNGAKDYNKASMVGERVAELGTELGRGVQVFSLLGRVLDTPEKAQIFLSRQVKKLDAAMRARQPAIDAAKEVLGDVQAEALKLLEGWLDQINGVAGKPASARKPARVEDLPDLTFSLTMDMRKSGIVSVVSRMLKDSGAAETRKALVEKYGEKITPFIPDILIESQKLLMKRAAPPAKKKAEKKDAKEAKPKSGPRLPANQVDAALEDIRRTARKSSVQLDDVSIDEHFTGKRMTPKQVDAVLEQAKKLGLPLRQETLAFGEEVKKALMTDEAIDVSLEDIRRDAAKSDVQLDMTAIDEHFTGKRMTDAQIDETLAMARAFGLGGYQPTLDGLADIAQRLEDEVIARLKVRGFTTPETVRNAVRKLFDEKGVKFTPADIAKVFADKFQVPKATDAQRKRLAELAENIRSTPDRSTERTDATIDLMNHVNDILRPVDVIDKAWAVWYANILSGYNTHFRNMYANVLEQLVALPLDAVRANPVATLHLMREMLFGVKAGASIGVSEAKQQLKTGNASVLQTDANKFSSAGTLERVRFAGGNANPFNWLKVVGRALRAEDLFAYATASEAKARMVAWEMATAKGKDGANREAEIERLLNATEEQIGDFTERAVREWEDLTDELRAGKDRGAWVKRRVSELRILERDAALIERASEFAARATFNFKPDGFVGVMANGLTDALGRLSQVEATGKLEAVQKALMTAPKLVVPFVRIVANVLNRGIDYTGLGVVRSELPSKRVGSLGTGTEFVAKSADERAMELKRGIFGIVTLGVLSAMADPEDEEALIQIHGSGAGSRDRNQSLNGPRWMPYSIEIRTDEGSKFVTYQYSPLLLGLALVGNWHDARRYKKLDEKETTERLAMAATGIGSVLLDQSFLSNAADLVNMFGRNGQVSERALYSFLGRTFNPATVAVPFSSLLRQMERDFDPVQRDRPDIMASLMSQVPVAARFNEPALDVLGDPIVNRPMDWFARASADGTPEARIYRAFGEKDAVPTGIWTYKGKMEPEQFYAFTKERGAFLKESLMRNDAALLKSIEAADPEVAAQIVENISRTATQVARARVGYVPEPKTKR